MDEMYFTHLLCYPVRPLSANNGTTVLLLPEEITVTASAHRGDSFALQDQSMPGTFRLEDNMGCGECLHVLGLACLEELGRSMVFTFRL